MRKGRKAKERIMEGAKEEKEWKEGKKSVFWKMYQSKT